MNPGKAFSIQSVLAPLQARALTRLTDADFAGCHISDLLSDVLAHAPPGGMWVTIQIHRNVVSVAAMKDLVAVLFTAGRQPEPAVVAEADQAGIVLLSTPLSTYAAAGKLWETGIR